MIPLMVTVPAPVPTFVTELMGLKLALLNVNAPTPRGSQLNLGCAASRGNCTAIGLPFDRWCCWCRES